MKNNIEINADAIRLRKVFGEDIYSPIDIFSIFNESDDITVVFYPMSERMSGICIKDEKNKIVAINSSLSYGRQRFTIAHELCHLFFHDDFKKVICPKDIDMSKDPQEIEANAFASYFLMPYEALQEFVREKIKKVKGNIEVADVVRIEQYFGMSRQAVLWRLIKEGYLTFDKADTMKTGIIISATRLGYDNKLYLPTIKEKQYYTLGKYIRFTEQTYEDGMLSEGKYEELLLDAFRSDIVYGLDEEGLEKYD